MFRVCASSGIDDPVSAQRMTAATGHRGPNDIGTLFGVQWLWLRHYLDQTVAVPVPHRSEETLV